MLKIGNVLICVVFLFDVSGQCSNLLKTNDMSENFITILRFFQSLIRNNNN